MFHHITLAHLTVGPRLLIDSMLSVLLFAGALLVRSTLLKLTPSNASMDERRRRMVKSRTWLVICVLLGLIAIWGHELRTIAVSLVAVAAAFMVTGKEFVMCLLGSFNRASSRLYGLGDRIEVNGVRGDVIDQKLLYCTVMEVGPGRLTQQYTGRVVHFPTSWLLEKQVYVESFTGDYSAHHITLPLNTECPGWETLESALLAIAQEVCTPFMDNARQHMDDLMSRYAVDLPNVEPRVLLIRDEESRWAYLLRIVVPTKQKAQIEQTILREFLKAELAASKSTA